MLLELGDVDDISYALFQGNVTCLLCKPNVIFLRINCEDVQKKIQFIRLILNSHSHFPFKINLLSRWVYQEVLTCQYECSTLSVIYVLSCMILAEREKVGHDLTMSIHYYHVTVNK